MKNLGNVIVGMLFLFSAHVSYAVEYPNRGSVFGTKAFDSIIYSCVKLGADKIKCQFNQTGIRKKDDIKSDEEIKKIAQKLLKNPKEHKPDKKSCKSIRMLIDKKLIPSEKVKADINVVRAMNAMCKEYSLKTIINYIKADNIRDNRTCKIFSNSYDQQFKHVYETGAWVVSDEPSGSCGIINLSRFEKAKVKGSTLTFWNYISKKTITNPKGEFVFGASCSALDENEYLYQWHGKQHHLGCDIIEFGF